MYVGRQRVKNAAVHQHRVSAVSPQSAVNADAAGFEMEALDTDA
jgi:hypothetical protein